MLFDPAVPTPDLDTVLGHLPDPFFTVDRDWRITAVNTAAAAFAGRDARDFLGQNLWTQFPELLGTPFEHAGRQAMHGRVVLDVEGYFPPRDVWVSARLFPHGTGLGVHFRDITQGKQEEARRARLQDLTRRLAQTTTLRDVTSVVLHAALETTGAFMGAVLLLADDGRTFELTDALSASPDLAGQAHRFDAADDLPATAAVRSGEPVLLNLGAPGPFGPTGEAPSGGRVRAVAALPLHFEAGVQGVLQLSFDGERDFGDAQRHDLITLAGYCAHALNRARALERERQGRERADFLAHAGELLSSSLDPQDVLRQLAELAVPRLADSCSVFLPDRSGGLTPLVITHTDPDRVRAFHDYWKTYPVWIDAPAGVGCAFRTLTAALVEHVDVDALRPYIPAAQAEFIEQAGLTSVIDVPLVARGRALGVLELISTRPERTYTPEDLAFAQDLARRAAVALDNAQLHEQASRELSERERAELALRDLNVTLEDRVEERTYQLLRASEELAARNRAFEAFSALARDLMMESDEVRLVQHAQERLLQLMPEAVSALFSLEDGAWRVRAVQGDGAGDLVDELRRRTRHGGDASLLDRTLDAGRPVYLEHLQEHAQDPSGVPGHFAALATFPLPDQDHAGSVLVLALKRQRRWEARDRALLETAASQLQLALERARAVALVQRHSALLEQRAAELQLLNADLEAFTFSISHDLRAPVRHISTFAGLLEQRAALADPRDERILHTIRTSAERMNEMIQGLLAFAHIARQPLTFTPVDLTALVMEVRQDLEPEYEGRSVRWTVEPLPVVPGDRATLRMALTNLLGNAVKYTAFQELAEIHVTASLTDTEHVLAVRDNGVGFDPQFATRLFGVFERLHSQTQFEGVGLGLWTVARIVTRHGGRVWAQGEVGRGATFFVALPRIEGAPHDT